MTIKVYSKQNCPACVTMKTKLDGMGVTYEEVRVDQDPAVREWLVSQGHRSVPQLYQGDVHVKDVADLALN